MKPLVRINKQRPKPLPFRKKNITHDKAVKALNNLLMSIQTESEMLLWLLAGKVDGLSSYICGTETSNPIMACCDRLSQMEYEVEEYQKYLEHDVKVAGNYDIASMKSESLRIFMKSVMKSNVLEHAPVEYMEE